MDQIAWLEGMALSPQHFQQNDRLMLAKMQDMHSFRSDISWGIFDMSLDVDSLGNGLIQVLSLKGLFSDGQLINVNANLLSRSMHEALENNAMKSAVYLGFPLVVEGQKNLKDEAHCSPWLQDNQDINDLNTGSHIRPVAFIQNQYKLLFDSDNRSGHKVLQIGEIIRNSQGEAVFNEKFIPPFLYINQQQECMRELRNILSAAVAKQTYFTSLSFAAQASEIESYLYLDTLNRHIPVLNYLLSKNTHPEQVYIWLLSFCSSLSLVTKVPVGDVPVYSQKSPGEGLLFLIQLLKQMLNAKSKGKYVVSTMDSINNLVYGKAIDYDMVKYPKALLGFHVTNTDELDSAGLESKIKNSVKISSREQLQALVSSAVNGVELSVASQYPVGFAPKAGVLYFSVGDQSSFWKQVVASKTLAVYVPQNLQAQKIEIIAYSE